MAFDVVPVQSAGFAASCEQGARQLIVRLKGSLDMESEQLFDQLLNQVHGTVLRLKLDCVQVDCEELYFMNSMSIKRLITWAMKVKQTESRSRYGIHFLTNGNLTWQPRALDPIVRFAGDFVTVVQKAAS